MSCIVYMTNKKSGHVYAYESTSYRDPITKKPKSKRKYLGRVDPVTKEFITTSKNNALPGQANISKSADYISKEEMENLRNEVSLLREELAQFKKAQKETTSLIKTIEKVIHNSLNNA